jgi:hypothetical protein
MVHRTNFLKKELFFARPRPPLPLIKVVKCFCWAEKPNFLPTELAFPFLGERKEKTKIFFPPISFLWAKFANQF